MKKLLLTFLILSSISSFAQNVNLLSKEEFNDIEINGVRWGEIVSTQGDGQKMKELFGDNMGFSAKTEPYPGRSFGNNNGLAFYFEDRSENGDYTVVHMALYNQANVLSIKGVNLSIGQAISPLKNALGGPILEIEGEQLKRIAFSVYNQNFSLGINYNPETKLISEIKFTEYD